MRSVSALLVVLAWFAPNASVFAAQESVKTAVYTEPASVEVGEPFACIVAVEHLAHALVAIEGKGPLPDEPGVSAPSWIALGERRVSRFAIDGQPERVRTLFKWNVASLEAGDRALLPLKVRVTVDGHAQEIETKPLTVSIRSALGEGEDVPRAQKGFLPPPDTSVKRTLWLGLVIAAAALALAWRIWRKRRMREQSVVAPPTALELFIALEQRAKAMPEAAREITYDVSKLLRHAVDAHLGEERAALTDAHWLARVEPDERVPLGVRTALARMLRDAERIKYALETPTRFALEEELKDARAVLEALASAPSPVKEAA